MSSSWCISKKFVASMLSIAFLTFATVFFIGITQASAASSSARNEQVVALPQSTPTPQCTDVADCYTKGMMPADPNKPGDKPTQLPSDAPTCLDEVSCYAEFRGSKQEGLTPAARELPDPVKGILETFFNLVYDMLFGNVKSLLDTTARLWSSSQSVTPDQSPVSASLQRMLYPFVLFIAVAGVIWQAMIMMLTRKAEPLVNIIRGLITVSLWSAIGLIGPSMALRIADAFTVYVMNASWDASHSEMPNINTGTVGSDAVGSVAGTAGTVVAYNAASKTLGKVSTFFVRPPFQVAIIIKIVLLVFVLIVAVIQYLIIVFREMAVIMLSGTIVLAAAGSFTASTKQWLPKVLSMMLALIVYKPAVALVYYSASLFSSADTPDVDLGTNIKLTIMSYMAIFLSIFALPALMRFFTWGTGLVAGGGLGASHGVINTWAMYGRRT